MLLDRSEMIKAIKFLKPAILKADESEQDTSEKIRALTHVHVKIEGDVCTMTAGDGHCGKRVILNHLAQLMLETEEKEIHDGNFLIPRATLEAFETLCSKHKAKLEKSSRIDHSLKFIDIFPDALESHKDRIEYNQPVGVVYPEIDRFFHTGADPVEHLNVNAGVVIDALKEFTCNIQITFSGEDGPVYIQTEDMTFQAFFMVQKRENDD